eukprot:761769-Hanusia_phi.AAC.6
MDSAAAGPARPRESGHSVCPLGHRDSVTDRVCKSVWAAGQARNESRSLGVRRSDVTAYGMDAMALPAPDLLINGTRARPGFSSFSTRSDS